MAPVRTVRCARGGRGVMFSCAEGSGRPLAAGGLTFLGFLQGGGGAILAVLSLNMYNVLLVTDSTCFGSVSPRRVTQEDFPCKRVHLRLKSCKPRSRGDRRCIRLRGSGLLASSYVASVGGVRKIRKIGMCRNAILGIRIPAKSIRPVISRMCDAGGRGVIRGCLVRNATSLSRLVEGGKIIVTGSLR